MKRIERNLPLADTYSVLSITRRDIETAEMATICDNCNAEIINVATVENQNKKQFHVGLDCVKTLTNVEDKKYLQKHFNTALGFAKKAAKADGVQVDGSYIYIQKLDPRTNRLIRSSGIHKSDLERFNLQVGA